MSRFLQSWKNKDVGNNNVYSRSQIYILLQKYLSKNIFPILNLYLETVYTFIHFFSFLSGWMEKWAKLKRWNRLDQDQNPKKVVIKRINAQKSILY